MFDEKFESRAIECVWSLNIAQVPRIFNDRQSAPKCGAQLGAERINPSWSPFHRRNNQYATP
jgi:hypothetical protein